MLINRLLPILIVALSGSNSFSIDVNIRFPQDQSVKIKPDLSGLGQEVGEAAGEVVRKGILGAMEGFSQAAKGSEFGQLATEGMQNITQQGASAFRKTMEDPRLRREMQEGGRELAEVMGAGTRSFTKGLQQEVFPEIKALSRSALASMYNVQNAVQIGGPIALAAIIGLTGFYGTR
ncbi:MAG TPA: hypothetical protein VLB80_05365, partial [Candidatus Babeliales bacterium]|nr:hypothetical protein [Candidatus Babeliales bacterium]